MSEKNTKLDKSKAASAESTSGLSEAIESIPVPEGMVVVQKIGPPVAGIVAGVGVKLGHVATLPLSVVVSLAVGGGTEFKPYTRADATRITRFVEAEKKAERDADRNGT